MSQLSQTEIKALLDMWVQIAPHELFDYKATCLEKKAAFELKYKIPDFWSPDQEDKDFWEDVEYREWIEDRNRAYDERNN